MDEETTPGPVTFDIFCSIDIRVGTVLKAEKVTKSDKMLKLEVSFGDVIGVRTILAGVAQSYMPESLVGAKVLGVINLPPRKMFGTESQGMLLFGKAASGESLLHATCAAPDGARVM